MENRLVEPDGLASLWLGSLRRLVRPRTRKRGGRRRKPTRPNHGEDVSELVARSSQLRANHDDAPRRTPSAALKERPICSQARRRLDSAARELRGWMPTLPVALQATLGGEARQYVVQVIRLDTHRLCKLWDCDPRLLTD